MKLLLKLITDCQICYMKIIYVNKRYISNFQYTGNIQRCYINVCRYFQLFPLPATLICNTIYNKCNHDCITRIIIDQDLKTHLSENQFDKNIADIIINDADEINFTLLYWINEKVLTFSHCLHYPRRIIRF